MLWDILTDKFFGMSNLLWNNDKVNSNHMKTYLKSQTAYLNLSFNLPGYSRILCNSHMLIALN